MNQSLTYELNQVMPDAQQTGLFPSLATFYDRTGAVDTLGQVDLADLLPVAGLENIPCMIAAVSALRPQVQGGRTPDHFFEAPERHVLLNDYYAAILQRYLVNVDGTLYEITPGGVEADTQQQMTRVAVRAYQL